MPAVAHALRRSAPAYPKGDLTFDACDFERVRQLILARAGISLHAGKQAMVYSRLVRRLRETGHPSFAGYLKSLEASADAGSKGEWQEFVNCLTTNLTAFFREEHHFAALAEALRLRASQRLRIWCAAASTGEEPYSVAMTVAESIATHAATHATADAAADVRIVATDIDTQVLATAQRGVYRADARGLSPQRLQQHCLRGTGVNSGLVRIKPELARGVEFRPHNLMTADWSFGEPFDMVFCRNVLIYFDPAAQREVLARIHRVLKPGGLLFVGHSENFSDLRALFQLRGKTIYQRL